MPPPRLRCPQLGPPRGWHDPQPHCLGGGGGDVPPPHYPGQVPLLGGKPTTGAQHPEKSLQGFPPQSGHLQKGGWGPPGKMLLGWGGVQGIPPKPDTPRESGFAGDTPQAKISPGGLVYQSSPPPSKIQWGRRGGATRHPHQDSGVGGGNLCSRRQGWTCALVSSVSQCLPVCPPPPPPGPCPPIPVASYLPGDEPPPPLCSQRSPGAAARSARRSGGGGGHR